MINSSTTDETVAISNMDEDTLEKHLCKMPMTQARLTPESVEAMIALERYHQYPGTTLIVCALTLKNGFTVTGTSACASPSNFNEETGKGIARRNARNKIWELEGYALRNQQILIEHSTPLMAGDKMYDMGCPPVTYIGTKVVYAVPLTLGAYNKLRGWTIPEGEDPKKEGYLVQYADGGGSNVVGFNGYVSWSPRDVFEDNYKAYGVAMKTSDVGFVDRIRREQAELLTRSEKLSVFMVTEKFSKLPVEDRELLAQQQEYMVKYLAILDRRIARLMHAKNNDAQVAHLKAELKKR